MSFFEQLVKQSNTDEWYTQAKDVQIIVPYLSQNEYRKILCPFDTRESNFVKVLRNNGFDVSYSCITTGVDFFEIDNLSDYDAIVSNPPFSKRQRVLERLFNANVPFAMIMNFNGLFDNRIRYELFKSHKFEILVPRDRMNFFNETCNGGCPNFQSVYVCSKILPNQIVFDGDCCKGGRNERQKFNS
ncbi:MAG: hypothetical protein IKU45_04005 [Clostridia bacterium]|nr:hypothetical protein [Clostridia bacterium]